MRGRTPLDCWRKERNQRFLFVFFVCVREREREKLPRKCSKMPKNHFFLIKNLGGLGVK